MHIAPLSTPTAHGDPVRIRPGRPEDIEQVFDLIVELAIFERAPDEVENTAEQLREDGFGTHPAYSLIVAEGPERLVGMALSYIRYSTWKGRRLYLEDLVVTERWRGQGIGRRLLDAVVADARTRNCNGLVWQVLDWNVEAIRFYERLGAAFDNGWVNVSLRGDQVRNWPPDGTPA